MNPVTHVALVVTSLLGMVFALGALRKRFGWSPELARKLAHVGLGLAVLTFPAIFDRAWPAVLFAAVAVALLSGIRRLPSISTRLGGVLDGVRRNAGGEFYFPAAVAVLFALSRGDPVTFRVPILALTFADTAAALAGSKYGRIHYRAGKERKSLEGSIAFFAVAFATTHLPLLLWTGVGRVESVVIGLACALVLTLVEAVSLAGTDNLFIPLAGYFGLDALLRRDAPEFAAVLFVVFLLWCFALARRNARPLSRHASRMRTLVPSPTVPAGFRWRAHQ